MSLLMRFYSKFLVYADNLLDFEEIDVAFVDCVRSLGEAQERIKLISVARSGAGYY